MERLQIGDTVECEWDGHRKARGEVLGLYPDRFLAVHVLTATFGLRKFTRDEVLRVIIRRAS